jgi:hypothetical protein
VFNTPLPQVPLTDAWEVEMLVETPVVPPVVEVLPVVVIERVMEEE